MTLRAGDLCSQIVIQAPSTTQDEIGQPVLVWTDFASVWADIRMKSGLETIKAGAVTSTVQASIRIRYRTDLTAGMRAVHNGVIYNITSVMPDVSRRVYTDLAVEVVV